MTPETRQDDEMEQRAKEILFNCGYTTQGFRDFLPKINFLGGLPLLLEVMTEFAAAFARQEVAAERQRVVRLVAEMAEGRAIQIQAHQETTSAMNELASLIVAIRKLGGTE